MSVDNTSSQQTDVNTQADAQTAGDSSSTTQQTSDANTTNDTNSSDTQDKGINNASDTLADGSDPNAKIPIRVVQEMRQKQQTLERELAEQRTWRQQQEATRLAQTQQDQARQNPEAFQAKQQLKQLFQELAPELGFVSKQEMQQQQAINEVRTTHDQLSTKYNGKDGLPKYDSQAVTDFAINILGMNSAKGLEHAYKIMHENEIMNARIQKGIQQTRGVKSEQSNGTGSANTGVSEADLKKAAQSGDKEAINLLIKRRLSKK